MTRYILLIAAAAFTYINACGQDMNEALKKTFLAFDTTQDVATKNTQANKLALISKKWKDEWAPHYYVAYAKAGLSFMESDAAKRDAMLDEADAEMDEAVAILGKDNDETYVVRAMLAQARMAVDGQNRWQKYGKLFDDNLKKAKEINENNPRIYYMKGTAVYFTPKAFGGGAKNAVSYFEKAKPLFAQDNSGDMSKPFWGARANDYFLMQCQKNEDAPSPGKE